jgi:hypothetical protein
VLVVVVCWGEKPPWVLSLCYRGGGGGGGGWIIVVILVVVVWEMYLES